MAARSSVDDGELRTDGGGVVRYKGGQSGVIDGASERTGGIVGAAPPFRLRRASWNSLYGSIPKRITPASRQLGVAGSTLDGVAVLPAAARGVEVATETITGRGVPEPGGCSGGVGLYKRLYARASQAANFPAVLASLGVKHQRALASLGAAIEGTFEATYSQIEREKRYSRWQQAFAKAHSRTLAMANEEATGAVGENAERVQLGDSSLAQREAGAGDDADSGSVAAVTDRRRGLAADPQPDVGDDRGNFLAGKDLAALQAKGGPLDPARLHC